MYALLSVNVVEEESRVVVKMFLKVVARLAFSNVDLHFGLDMLNYGDGNWYARISHIPAAGISCSKPSLVNVIHLQSWNWPFAITDEELPNYEIAQIPSH